MENYTFIKLNQKDYERLTKTQKENFSNQIKNIHSSIGLMKKDITHVKNEIIFICYDEKNIVGYIHLVPCSTYDMTITKNYFSKYYIDYVAISKNHQNKGLASCLYDLSISYLMKSNVKEVSAILQNEYSQKACLNVAKKNKLKYCYDAVSNTITIFLDKKSYKVTKLQSH